MTLALLFLIALGVTSLGVAAYTFVVDRRRQALVERALGVTDAEVSRRSALLGAAKKKQRRGERTQADPGRSGNVQVRAKAHPRGA